MKEIQDKEMKAQQLLEFEFEFVIKHSPGSAVQDADFMSRWNPLILNQRPISFRDLLEQTSRARGLNLLVRPSLNPLQSQDDSELEISNSAVERAIRAGQTELVPDHIYDIGHHRLKLLNNKITV